MLRSSWLVGAAGALIVAGVALAFPAQAATPVNFFVAPNGSDSNAGTSAGSPFQTLGRAQAAVRAVDQSTSGPVTVTLAGGVYRLANTLTFTAADSGGAGGDVWWKAAAGQFPVVSGAVRITGWSKSDAAKNIWSAPATASLDTRQLYVDGKRAQRATGALPV